MDDIEALSTLLVLAGTAALDLLLLAGGDAIV